MTTREHIPFPAGAPNDLAFSPDGRLLAVAADAGAVHLLDPATGDEVRALGDHDVDEVTALDFAPEGGVLASCDLSSSVYVWSVRSGVVIGQVTHEHGGHFLAYTGKGRILISAGLTDTVALIEADRMQVAGTLVSPVGELVHTAISGDRLVLAAFTAHDRVIAWDLDNAGTIARLRAAELTGTTCIAVSPDGREIATGTSSGAVYLWTLSDDAAPPVRLDAHQGAVRFLAYAPDGHALASTGADQLLRLWRRPDLAPAGLAPTGREPGLLAFAPDARSLAVDAGADELRVLELSDGALPAPRAE